jgi:hypothetical protein
MPSRAAREDELWSLLRLDRFSPPEGLPAAPSVDVRVPCPCGLSPECWLREKDAELLLVCALAYTVGASPLSTTGKVGELTLAWAWLSRV